MGVLSEVYAEVPQHGEAPFVIVDAASEIELNHNTLKANQWELTIHIYSEYGDFWECIKILQRINDLLEGVTLILPDQEQVELFFDNLRTLDEDRFKHIPLTYRAIAE